MSQLHASAGQGPAEPGEALIPMTLDELEQATGVPARTIRFYRQEGLIAPPTRVGRKAFYDPEQLPRLRLIAALRDRGLGLDAVSKILADPEGEHRSFTTLLDLRDELLEPWIDDDPVQLSSEEILGVIGVGESQALDNLAQFGIIASDPSQAEGTYTVPSLATLDLAAQLLDAGVRPEVAHASWVAMQRHTAAMADELVDIFVSRDDNGFTSSATPARANEGLRQLRIIALQAVQVAFAHEIERALQGYFRARADQDGPA